MLQTTDPKLLQIMEKIEHLTRLVEVTIPYCYQEQDKGRLDFCAYESACGRHRWRCLLGNDAHLLGIAVGVDRGEHLSKEFQDHCIEWALYLDKGDTEILFGANPRYGLKEREAHARELLRRAKVELEEYQC